MNQRFAGISDVLQRYYDGLYYCDADLLARVFHPQAVYHTTSGGAHLVYDMPAYLDVIRARTSPANAGDEYGYEVQSIRFAGDDTALAVLTCTMMGKRFTDFLSFIRTGADDEAGSWRIAAKVFHYDII